jgi:hypothetical protein
MCSMLMPKRKTHLERVLGTLSISMTSTTGILFSQSIMVCGADHSHHSAVQCSAPHITNMILKKKSKVIPLQAMEAHGVRAGTAPTHS